MPFQSPFRPSPDVGTANSTRRPASTGPGRRRRHLLIVIALLITALLASSASAHSGPEAHQDEDVEIRSVVFPVVGPNTYTDTFGACRGPGCSRSHKGVDIFTNRLAPLVAAVDGTIVFERTSGLGLGGNAVTIQDDEGWRYVYVHLNNDSPGTDDGANPQGWVMADRLRKGDRVEAGQVIGYLGDSGNAETTPAHLHFEIRKPGVGAINPTASVDQARTEGRVVPTDALASTSAQRAEFGPVVAAWYRALLKREPTEDELFAWTDRMAVQLGTADDLIADLTMARPRRDPAGSIVRSYEVMLDRLPTIEEIRGWEARLRDGSEHRDVVAALLSDSESSERNPNLDEEAFIRTLFANGAGREPSGRGVDEWLAQFEDGASRTDVAVLIVDSFPVKDATWHDLQVVQAFRASLDRMPTSDEWSRWAAHLDAGGRIPDVVEAIRAPADTGAPESADEAQEPTTEAQEPTTEAQETTEGSRGGSLAGAEASVPAQAATAAPSDPDS